MMHSEFFIIFIISLAGVFSQEAYKEGEKYAYSSNVKNELSADSRANELEYIPLESNELYEDEPEIVPIEDSCEKLHCNAKNERNRYSIQPDNEPVSAKKEHQKNQETEYIDQTKENDISEEKNDKELTEKEKNEGMAILFLFFLIAIAACRR